MSQAMSGFSSQLSDQSEIHRSDEPAWYEKDWVKPEQLISSTTYPYFGNNISNPPQQHMTLWRPTANCILFHHSRMEARLGYRIRDMKNSNPSIGEIVHNIPVSDSYQWQGNYLNYSNNSISTPVRIIRNKAKRIRTAFTTNQILTLEDIYKHKLYVSKSEREILSNRLGLTERAIKVWFQNRRMKGKKVTEENLYNEQNPDVYNEIEAVVSDINNCPVHNEFVHIDTNIINKLGEIIHQRLPNDLNMSQVIQSTAEIPNYTNNNIESSIISINSSENSESGIDMDEKFSDQSDVIESELSSISETIDPKDISSDESPVVKKPSQDILKMLFDKHFC